MSPYGWRLTLRKKYASTRPGSAVSAVGACPGYASYGYGLDGHLPPYLAARGVAPMRAAYRTRRVTYLSGSSDVCDAPDSLTTFAQLYSTSLADAERRSGGSNRGGGGSGRFDPARPSQQRGASRSHFFVATVLLYC